ncbi:MAG: hypothetical protein R3Y46_05315 [Opitutales bacterium]
MKFLHLILLALIASLTACTSDLRDDAGDTPIGSVFTGETRSTGEYFKKVSEQNRNSTQSAWQPKTDGRF